MNQELESKVALMARASKRGGADTTMPFGQSRLNPRYFVAAVVLLALAFFLGNASSVEPAEKGKLMHVGLVWLKDHGNPAERRRLVEALHRFAREIPEVRSLSVGQPHASASKLVDSTFDVCFTMQFDDQQALDRYSKNPVHQKAAEEAFLPLSQKIEFYDFITE